MIGVEGDFSGNVLKQKKLRIKNGTYMRTSKTQKYFLAKP